jgi:hypothetical protein
MTQTLARCLLTGGLGLLISAIVFVFLVLQLERQHEIEEDERRPRLPWRAWHHDAREGGGGRHE